MGDADVLIVGAGVAGSLLACELQQAGLKVHLLEAGGSYQRQRALRRYRDAWNRNFQAAWPDWPWASVPHLDDPEHYYGKQALPAYNPAFIKGEGGTTLVWTGMTPRFLPEDFRLHSRYGVGHDWPVDYEELEPWYVQAEDRLGVAGEGDQGSPRSAPYPMPAIPLTYGESQMARTFKKHGLNLVSSPAARNSRPWQQRPPCCGSNTCTPICPSGARYDAALDVQRAKSLGVKVSSGMVAWNLEHQGERIVAVHAKTRDGHSQRLTARRVVLACNSIETPRLLLMSASPDYPEGLANRSGQVGRNLMDHLLLRYRFSTPEPVWPGRGPQAIAHFLHGRQGDFRSSHAAAKLFVSNDADVMSQVSELLEKPANWFHPVEKLRQQVAHSSAMGAEIETLPDPNNRLQLDAQRTDALGLPLPRIDYTTNGYSERGEKHWHEELLRLIDLLGGTPVKVKRSLSAHHPCGTTRMGKSATDSVVNAHGQCHDHPNLYIVGGSVFPSIGTANPTLTIAALSLRLAAHLKQTARQAD